MCASMHTYMAVIKAGLTVTSVTAEAERQPIAPYHTPTSNKWHEMTKMPMEVEQRRLVYSGGANCTHWSSLCLYLRAPQQMGDTD